MEYRRLGDAGITVSQYSLGGWTTFGASVKDASTVKAVITHAFDNGVNFFDIADAYGRGEAERMMGAVLADMPRRHLVISSKCYWPLTKAANDRGLSRKHLFESVHDSLKRIGTDYLDLFFCHRFDEETPLEETVRALDDLVTQGKVLYWGTSEWTGDQVRDAQVIASKRGAYAPVVEQPQYSLLHRHRVETQLRPVTTEFEMGTVVWSPLGSGLLTGKYDDGIPEGSRLERIGFLKDRLFQDELREKVRGMLPIAERLGCSRTQLALAWTAAQPGISSVILGATSVDQLKENLGAIEVDIDGDAEAELDRLFPSDSSLDD